MSVERDHGPASPEQPDARTALLRRMATAQGREGVMDEALAGKGGDLGREYLDLLGRSMMTRSAQLLANRDGVRFEPLGARDAANDERAKGYARTMEGLATVRGRDDLAARAQAGEPGRSPEDTARLQALRTPEGRVEQLRQARDYAAFYKMPFEATQSNERLFVPDRTGPPLRDRAAMLDAMASAEGRRDLVGEARRQGVVAPAADGVVRERVEVLAALRDPARREVVFAEAEALARHRGRPFEPLDRDAAYLAGGDRARAEVLEGLLSRHGRESLMREAIAWGQPIDRPEMSEAAGYDSERHRLVRGLSSPETRQPILDEARMVAHQDGRAFEPIRGDEEIAVRDRFNPGMNLGRTAEVEGAGNFSRERIAAMLGRIDGDLATREPDVQRPRASGFEREA